MYDDALIILTTDHGYCFGEREFIGKNYMPAYNEIANIPLLVHFPGGAFVGETRRQLTQNIDLMPTILDYQGVDVPDTVMGKSLRGVAERGESVHDYALYGTFGCSVNVTDGRYTFPGVPRPERAGGLGEGRRDLCQRGSPLQPSRGHGSGDRSARRRGVRSHGGPSHSGYARGPGTERPVRASRTGDIGPEVPIPPWNVSLPGPRGSAPRGHFVRTSRT